jgi:membrane-associated protease RseP (regulator of RpoE activity)
MNFFRNTPFEPFQSEINLIQDELIGLFAVEDVQTRGRGQVIAFRGRVLSPPETIFEELQYRLERHDYLPVLQRHGDQDVLLAIKGVAQQKAGSSIFVHLLLFLATLFTTIGAGAGLNGENLLSAIATADPAQILQAVMAGIPFAGSLLLILGIHELGHYAAARYHRINVSLPYFIPMPFSAIGTMGAFISLRAPMRDRRVLFDVGVAGPIAGFLVAVPIFMIGLWLSPVIPDVGRQATLDRFGLSLLTSALVSLLKDVPAGYSVAFHPVLFASWLGLFITSINLLPLGQLDGGHTIYAVFGRSAHAISRLTFALLLLAGFLFSSQWLFWAFFALLGGLDHQPPLNDITPLDAPRKRIAFFTLLMFFITFVPRLSFN